MRDPRLGAVLFPAAGGLREGQPVRALCRVPMLARVACQRAGGLELGAAVFGTIYESSACAQSQLGHHLNHTTPGRVTGEHFSTCGSHGLAGTHTHVAPRATKALRDKDWARCSSARDRF